ncbi:hypothetical protein DAERI_080003 [Deinococcus aerius]|uniref:Uncharacterized protein n=1 Tax=Deinococcus aerius TaxID=200253 RepID=A0A2I9CW65_9DEIO|nr:hypothetical protein DAERI_080003 [Deinococcus aerius]
MRGRSAPSLTRILVVVPEPAHLLLTGPVGLWLLALMGAHLEGGAIRSRMVRGSPVTPPTFLTPMKRVSLC